MATASKDRIPGWAWVVGGTLVLTLIGGMSYFGRVLVAGYLRSTHDIELLKEDRGRHDERLKALERGK